MTRRRAPNSWTSVRLPERDLGETILEFASPLLGQLGDTPAIDEERRALTLAICFWNASVLASKLWDHPRPKELHELKKRLRGQDTPRKSSAVFDLLTERRRAHWLDPRLVEQWSYQLGESGARVLRCAVGLPEGVRAEVPTPIEKRITIGGLFLDEVKIREANTGCSFLRFPLERHSAIVSDDGTVTVYAMMPTALQLFVEGRLPHVDGPPVDVAIGGRALGPLVLTEVRCAGGARHDVAALVFRPPATDSPEATR